MSLPYSIVNPLTRIEVVRHLPLSGKILVHVEDPVQPLQNVAEMTQLPDFRIVDLGKELRVPPKKAQEYLQVKVGVRVAKGQILASRGGMGGSVCKAPFDGIVTGYGRGRLLLEALPSLVQLNALVPGTVVQVIPGKSVTIETRGAFIHGAWGNGKEGYGVLQLVAKTARHVLRAKRLDASAQGAIIIGGASLDNEALDQAVEMQVQGIIVGGISPAMIPRLLTVDFPVVATEGVGEIPMSKAAFELLRSLSGRETALSGRLSTRDHEERPYIVVPMPSNSGGAVNPEAPLTVGSRVRGLRPPYLGLSGVIAALPGNTILIDSGARLPAVQVDFDGEVMWVPWVNLERLL